MRRCLARLVRDETSTALGKKETYLGQPGVVIETWEIPVNSRTFNTWDL